MRTAVGHMCLVTICAAVACSDSSTTTPPVTVTVPDFIYVSDSGGRGQLYTLSNGVSTRFASTAPGDADPQSAAGRVVFSSSRDSTTSSKIYSAKVDGTDLQRLTTTGKADFTPSLIPSGSTIVFASLRTGTSRIWVMNSDGSNPAELATGSSENVPESVPRYSPDGTQILFDSPRTGTSQLWLIPTAGGSAVQLTHEINGAFNGSWGADGTTVFYDAGLDQSDIREVTIATGAVANYVSGGTDVSQPECNATMCLVVSGATTSAGDILAFVGAGSRTPLTEVHSSANERAPAFLHP